MILSKEKTASLDIDSQKGFTNLCPEELPVPHGEDIDVHLNDQAKFAKYRIGTKDWHPSKAIWIASKDKPQFSPVEGKNVDIAWNAHCIGGTYGAELLDALPHPCNYDFFIWKGMEPDMHPYGACYHDLEEKLSTGLIEFLISKKITTVILGGLATDYCVKTTAIQLKKSDFNVIVNLKACRGISIDTINSSIEEMKTMDIHIITNLDSLKPRTNNDN